MKIISGDQVRMARGALRMAVRELGELAGVDKMTVVRIEAGEGARASTFERLRSALEAAGVVFLAPLDGVHGAGVAFKWGFDTASLGATSGNYDATNKPGEGLDARSWDADFSDATPQPLPDLPPMTDAERESLRQHCRERWERISPIGKACMARVMGLNDSSSAP
jgi:transcriptional regulator with XRE-family HTH domain